jgi:hypothetical protein
MDEEPRNVPLTLEEILWSIAALQCSGSESCLKLATRLKDWTKGQSAVVPFSKQEIHLLISVTTDKKLKPYLQGYIHGQTGRLENE